MTIDFSSTKTAPQSTKGTWMAEKLSTFFSPSSAKSTTKGTTGTGSSITKLN